MRYPVTGEPVPDWVTKQHGLLWRTGTSTVVSCQCKSQPDPCAHMPTAEDLLCDHCRNGCRLQVADGFSVHLDGTAHADCTQRLQVLFDCTPLA